MKLAKKRPTYAIGKNKRGYAKYSHWSHSVADYMEWQRMREPVGCYITYLKQRGYATDDNYYRKLNGIKI
jgi:flagellum-specific peptidoglycan hydrolase FlgJ